MSRYWCVSWLAFGALYFCGAVQADNRSSGDEDEEFWLELAEKHTLVGQLAHMQRYRQRRDESGQTSSYQDDLNHGTLQTALSFKSGWLFDWIGFNASAFAAADITYDDDLPRNIENEFSFAGNKWGQENGQSAENGVSISRAVLKVRADHRLARIKIGYAPMHVPGILGVNWSFQPGTYRGLQFKYVPKHWTVTYAWADQYKAPWYKQTQYFSKLNAWDTKPIGGSNRIDYIHGLGVTYHPDHQSFNLQLGIGEAKDYMRAYHLKASWQLDWQDGLSLAYLFYGSESDNDPGYRVYNGLAWQQGVRAQLLSGRWQFRAELLATKAEGLGTYLPRLTRGYANSQGSNEYWWDSRSDWNNDGETALFTGAWYRLPTASGEWRLGASAAYGWGSTRWVDGEQDQSASTGEESAWNLDLAYSVSQGWLAGGSINLHYTDYRNHQDRLGSFYYANMFTSEKDIKLTVSKPLAF
ncbi:porin [Neiella marina]|uniref:Porin n=1 Tax=Neiella marina TaxID=508461 RepID=A0A8J2U9G2_9GAMM|nr:OprD family outer membrane porin [Neiella marina]GGA88431.1 porin [Neiella marina]